MPPPPGSPATNVFDAIREVQRIDLGGFPTTFTLTFRDVTTPSLNRDFTAAKIENLLTALPTIGTPLPRGISCRSRTSTHPPAGGKVFYRCEAVSR